MEHSQTVEDPGMFHPNIFCLSSTRSKCYLEFCVNHLLSFLKNSFTTYIWYLNSIFKLYLLLFLYKKSQTFNFFYFYPYSTIFTWHLSMIIPIFLVIHSKCVKILQLFLTLYFAFKMYSVFFYSFTCYLKTIMIWHSCLCFLVNMYMCHIIATAF